MPDSERDLRAIEVSIGDGETIRVEATPSSRASVATMRSSRSAP